jgi:hypothetical protein
MKRYLIGALCALMFAGCAGADDVNDGIDNGDWIELEPFTVINDPNPVADDVEKIFLPSPNYGIEVSTDLPCPGTTWNGGCLVPDNVESNLIFSFKILSSCSAADKTMIRASINEIDAQTDTLGNINFVEIADCGNRRPPCPSRVTIGCSTASGSLGNTSLNTEESHSSDLGTVHQFGFIVTTLRLALIDAAVGPTGAQKDNYKRNVVKHEVGHMLGFGHDADSLFDNTLMDPVGNLAFPTSTFWNTSRTLSTAQLNLLGCYNPTSSTTSRC